jgi:hypothetical protein
VSRRGAVGSRESGEIGFTSNSHRRTALMVSSNLMTLEGVYGAHAAVSVDWI